LREVTVLTEVTRAAWRDRSDNHPVTDCVALDRLTDLVDHPDRFVTDDAAIRHRILLTPDV
jgi:hypothetical protein